MAVGEWDERQLCPDGTCVGVIGPDGTCKVCGRVAPNWGDERKRGLIDPPDEDDEGDEDDEDGLAADDDRHGGDEDDDEDYLGDDEDEGEGDDDEAGQPATASSSSAPALPALAAPGDWGSRQLCPDGACIGLIGSDGRCKVCGRRASDAPSTGARTSAPEDGPDPGGGASADPAAVPRPCSDATCTGVAGAEGVCTVCGKLVA